MPPLVTQLSDHYLCAEGELSSSGCAIHPGERPTGADLRCRFSTIARSRRARPCAAGPPVVIEGRNGQVSQSAAGRVTEADAGDSWTSLVAPDDDANLPELRR